MSLHDRLTEDVRKGPSGPKVAALFDLDQTLLAGYSATAFFRERLLSGTPQPVPSTLTKPIAPTVQSTRSAKPPADKVEAEISDHIDDILGGGGDSSI